MFGGDTALAALDKLGTFITDQLLEPLEAFRSVLGQVTAVIVPFVDAIAPGTVRDFHAALADLSATIGSGLISSLQVLTSVVREVSGAILPLVQKMEPILTQLAGSLGEVLANQVRVMVDWVTDSVNLFKTLSQVLEKVTQFFAEFTAIIGAGIRTFTKVFGDLFGGGGEGGGLTNALQVLVDTVHEVTKAFVTLIANLLALAGFRDTLKTFADALAAQAKERDDRASGLKAAASNPRFADIGAIMRQQQLAAFNAAGAGGVARPKTNTDFLKEIGEDIKKIAAEKKDIKTALNDWWRDVAADGTNLGKAIKAAGELADRIGGFFTTLFGSIRAEIAGAVNSLIARLPRL